MYRRKNGISTAFVVVGAVVVAYFAVLAAPFHYKGLIWVISNLDYVISRKIVFCNKTGIYVLISEVIYGSLILYYISTRKNKRRGEEYGSAKWGDCKKINKKYSQIPTHDRILSQNLKIGYDSWKHQRNLFTCIIGGSGAKKTRGYVIPNILQMSGSMIILDPKGE